MQRERAAGWAAVLPAEEEGKSTAGTRAGGNSHGRVSFLFSGNLYFVSEFLGNAQLTYTTSLIVRVGHISYLAGLGLLIWIKLGRRFGFAVSWKVREAIPVSAARPTARDLG